MATECWPDRTPGDNRMWFEAKTEKKKKNQAGFSGKKHPWIMEPLHIRITQASRCNRMMAVYKTRTSIFHWMLWGKKGEDSLLMTMGINSKIMLWGEGRNQRQWFNCNLIDSSWHEQDAKAADAGRQDIFHNKPFILHVFGNKLGLNFTIRLISLCQSAIWHRTEPI